MAKDYEPFFSEFPVLYHNQQPASKVLKMHVSFSKMQLQINFKVTIDVNQCGIVKGDRRFQCEVLFQKIDMEETTLDISIIICHVFDYGDISAKPQQKHTQQVIFSFRNMPSQNRNKNEITDGKQCNKRKKGETGLSNSQARKRSKRGQYGAVCITYKRAIKNRFQIALGRSKNDVQIKGIQINQIQSFCNMKLGASFNYQNDIQKELVSNHQNLVGLFEQKFQKHIQTQKNLALNSIIDRNFKQTFMEYIKSPQIMQMMKKEVERNPFISKFLHYSHEGEKNKACFDNHLLKMVEKLEKKAGNENQPLTFYNQFVELSNKIQSCFIVKKGIREDGEIEDDNSELMNGKCGLKMKKHAIYYRFTFKCDFCKRGFKNQSGLKSHENTCKMAEKIKQTIEKRREICKRKSKRIFKTLDEERLHK